ncbi:MAG: CoA transferase [Chloroflexi bacterium]|nr:CoA transferase [Chloroflexota bacterium]
MARAKRRSQTPQATSPGPDAREGMLTPFRVLDLTEGGCLLGGKVMGDMGADVIKIERPGGSPSRSIGPFWHNELHPERSLFWMAYNVNKRSITLDLETADGRALFQQLVPRADFVFESFPPGYMEGLGLGYEALSRLNPRIIVAAVTPFGQTGPKAKYAWSDLTVWASGGPLYLTGEPDRPPVAVSFMHQAALNGGAEAAAAAMIAHYYRETTGEGQFIDVSMQEVAYWVVTSWQEFWETERTIPQRTGGPPKPAASGGRERRQLFPTKDGFIVFAIQGGAWGGGRSTKRVVEWMQEEGMAPEWLVAFDWDRRFDLSTMDAELVDNLESCFVRYFLTKAKEELSERAVREHVMIGPVYTPEEVATHRHLKERAFFEEVWDEVLNSKVVFCGPPVKASLTPLAIRRRPPLIGEHNQEIYCGMLGLTPHDLEALHGAGVI